MNAESRAVRACIEGGEAVLGIELGSTRIKAVLIGPDHLPLAVGTHSWENQLRDGVWTYDLEDVWSGLQAAYADLCAQAQQRCGAQISRLKAIGVSAMMHGYLAFDAQDRLLVPFRTWRNTTTLEASELLSRELQYTIPQRWSMSHLCQAVLNGEPHVPKVRFLTTLAGYVHWRLTGQKVVGVGDASGMFPIDDLTGDFHQGMLERTAAILAEKGFPGRVHGLLPRVLVAGEEAGRLSEEGARLLDASGRLAPGIPFCPPEGDAGTGMVATNAVAQRTGNISAGTSIFLMAVLEKALRRHYPEIDMVTTPSGRPVAMVHCNNCTTDLNRWVGLLQEFAAACDLPLDAGRVYEAFFDQALQGDPDAGGLLSYGYYSGEPITGFEEGRPLLAWSPESRLSFANLARAILFASLGTLRVGMDILDDEAVRLDRLVGHGGLYKTGTAGQRFTAAALRAPVTVMDHASEGGAWGIALLAAFLVRQDREEQLEDFLAGRVFSRVKGSSLEAGEKEIAGFDAFMARFREGLPLQQAAIDCLR